MKRLVLMSVAMAMIAPARFAHAELATNLIVRMSTTKGVVEIELDAQHAPITVANFLRHVRSGFYNGTIFHRVIPGFMVQGGGMTAGLIEKPAEAMIKNEANNGLKNLAGTVAMARTVEPDSASTQFFINTADNAFLDHRDTTRGGWGYAVFGKVTAGMDVVRQIGSSPTRNVGKHQNVPVEDVQILAIDVSTAVVAAGKPGESSPASALVAPANTVPISRNADSEALRRFYQNQQQSQSDAQERAAYEQRQLQYRINEMRIRNGLPPE